MHWRTARSIHDRLFAAYGAQGWWPADTPFEVIVGAVLTQNAAWKNVEYALENLRAAEALDPEAIRALSDERLGELIRPSGYFNVKAQRLKAVCCHVLDAGGVEGLADKPTAALRQDLLAVNGVGRETADDIVLYAFHRPVFVIDAYTRRIFSRLGAIDGREGYEELRGAFEKALGPKVEQFQEYHGLIVRHAKEACGARPACDRCCLRKRCPVGTGQADMPR
ncbi:MAG: endonuclease III domain-containing protein [Halofilum sp. (in: g-proteobacteria)]